MRFNKLPTSRSLIRFSIAVMLFLVGFGLGQARSGLGRREVGRRNEADLSLFWKVWDRVSAIYVDPKAIDPAKMVYGAISGMVSSLGDPYTVFLPPQENRQSKDDLGGSFEGVGIQLGYKDKQLAVISPLSGSPADRAGIKSGDLIINIRDEKAGVDKSTDTISLPEAVSLIRGPKGSEVVLKIFRSEEEKPREVALRRDTILVKSVELTFKPRQGGGRVAVFKLTKFGGRTDEEWNKAVDQIKQEELSLGGTMPVVLDLRNNPGGYLDGAVYMASEFLGSGIVVKQENRNSEENKTLEVNRKGRLLSEPLVVLVNEGSASAAEILAGALRDNHRAQLVGVKTFGKGTVQQPEDLPGGSGLHVTIARWLLPSGKWIDKVGVEPDVTVQSSKDVKVDLQLDKAIELFPG